MSVYKKERKRKRKWKREREREREKRPPRIFNKNCEMSRVVHLRQENNLSAKFSFVLSSPKNLEASGYHLK